MRAASRTGRSRTSDTAALPAAVAAPHPVAENPAAPIRSRSKRTEKRISSQHAPPPTVTVCPPAGIWSAPWGEVRWCSKASASTLARISGELLGRQRVRDPAGDLEPIGESDDLGRLLVAVDQDERRRLGDRDVVADYRVTRQFVQRYGQLHDLTAVHGHRRELLLQR